VQEPTRTAIAPQKGNTRPVDLKYDPVKIRWKKDKLNIVIGNKNNFLPKVLFLAHMDGYSKSIL
jgi:hypothetical protein